MLLRLYLQLSTLLVESVETASGALQKLRTLSQPDLPRALIMPWVLPVVRSTDFIRALKADRTLASMKIVVWGPGIPAGLIQSLYAAGAACVIPGRLDEGTGTALAEFCVRLGD